MSNHSPPPTRRQQYPTSSLVASESPLHHSHSSHRHDSQSHRKESRHEKHSSRDRDRDRDYRRKDRHGKDKKYPDLKVRDRSHDDHHDRYSKHKHSSSTSTKLSRSSRRSKDQAVINFDDHLNPLTPEEIAVKLQIADPKRIDHASFIATYNPTFLKAVSMSKTNFYTNEEKKRIQEAALKLFQQREAALNPPSSVEPDHTARDGKKPSLSSAELDAISAAVKKQPNYFSTDLLLTIGGGSVYKGQSSTTYSGVPGQGATAQLPTNFANTSLEIKTIDINSLQSQQESEKTPSQDFLSAVKQAQIQPGQNSTIKTRTLDIAMSRYQEPSNKIIPNTHNLPPTIPQVKVWYLSIHDNAKDLFKQFASLDSTRASVGDPQTLLTELVEHQQYSGEYLMNPIQSAQPPPIPLQKQSAYRIGADPFRNDIILTPTPPFPKPTPISIPNTSANPNLSPLDLLASTQPELKIKLESSQHQLQHAIDSIWNDAISNNSSILPIHCVLQFRLKSNPVKNNLGDTVQIETPTPYLCIPNTSSSSAGAQCYFRETSANSPTGFVKTPIPTNRFCEIFENDVIIVGDSHYELIFLSRLVPNPNLISR